jgi:hypothetical protein
MQLESLSGFGSKRVKNVLDAIEASKKAPVSALLLALGIAGIGSVTAQLLLQHCGGSIMVRTLASFVHRPELMIFIQKFSLVNNACDTTVQCRALQIAPRATWYSCQESQMSRQAALLHGLATLRTSPWSRNSPGCGLHSLMPCCRQMRNCNRAYASRVTSLLLETKSWLLERLE